jgi:hypothetical protein
MSSNDGVARWRDGSSPLRVGEEGGERREEVRRAPSAKDTPSMCTDMYQMTGGEWTAYRPPKKAKFGHNARRRDPRAAWDETKAFLANDCISVLQPTIELSCWETRFLTSRGAFEAGLREAERRFGAPHSRQRGCRRWQLGPSELEAGLAACRINAAWPGENLGPLTIQAWYLIAWRGYAAQDVTPATLLESEAARTTASMLGVSVWRQRLFLQPHFLFPVAWDSQALRDTLASLELRCPFRLREQYFQRLLPSKAGEYTVVRRLPKGWRATGGRREEGGGRRTEADGPGSP